VGSSSDASVAKSAASTVLQAETPASNADRRDWLRFVAQIGVQAGEALAYAHAQGVLHRDVKPSNILVDDQDVVRITDFGLAKIDGFGDLTATGDVPGTLRYLAPERLRGRSDSQSDVYSLGLVLYELLAGRPAFDAADRAELMKQVHDATPPALRRLALRVPRDLETIVVTCLQPDPLRRYQSAQELADDCRRYLEDRPIAAQRASAIEQLVRWARRNKATAASLAAAGVMLAMVAAGSLLAAAHFRRQEQVQRGLTLRNEQLADETRQQADALRQNLYFAEMNLAAQAAGTERGQGQALLLLDSWQHSKPDLRGWEWHYLWNLCSVERLSIDAHPHGVNAVAYSPDGTLLASGGWDGDVCIWNAADGSLTATLQQPSEATSLRQGNQYGITSVVWSPDGERIAAACWDSTIKVWEARSGRRLATLRGSQGGVVTLAWNPDSRQLASGGRDRAIRIWDSLDASQTRVLTGDLEDVVSVAWSPDGARLASASGDFGVQVNVWDANTGEQRLSIPISGFMRSIAWSADGRRLAAGGNDGSISIWDSADGREISVLEGHGGTISSVAWDHHGERLLSAGAFARTIKIWDAASAALLRTFGGHAGAVNAAAWSPDGKTIASASNDGTIKIWDATIREEPAAFRLHDGRIMAMEWSPGGERIASLSDDGMMKIWRPEAPGTAVEVATGADGESVVAWSPDGARVASAGPYKLIRIWDSINGAMLAELPRREEGFLRALAWSPDSKLLAASGFGLVITLWDTDAGVEVGTLIGHTAGVDALAFSLDGRRLASAGWDRTARMWDVAGKELLHTLSGHRDNLRSVVWSPDGRRAASADDEGVVKIWRAEDGRELFAINGHVGPVFAMSWNPLGNRLASCGFDGAVMIWDPAVGRPIVTLRNHDGAAYAVSWSPDGKRLASAGVDGAVYIYEADIPPER
jgi:WD40 repeat protein